MSESWGITANLGATALAVAAQRAAETAQDNPLIRDEFAAVLVASVDEPGWQAMASGDLSWMGPEDDIGRRTARTGREYVATRTVFFDEFCSAATMSPSTWKIASGKVSGTGWESSVDRWIWPI